MLEGEEGKEKNDFRIPKAGRFSSEQSNCVNGGFGEGIHIFYISH